MKNKNPISFLLFFLLGSVTCFSQSIVNRANNSYTVQDARFSAQLNLLVPRYNDTASATASIGIDTLGAIIFTYNTMSLWVRSGDPKTWVEVGSGGGGGGTWGSITGTLSDQTDLQAALDLKAPLASPTFTGTVTFPTPFTLGATSVLPTGTELNFVDGVTSNIQTQLDLKSPLASPTFTGIPIAPTATPATNNTQIATTAYVDAATAALGDITVGSITGAISLDSDDLGTLWQLSGTTTDYTVDLPTAVGNVSKSIIFKGLSTLTKNVTIAGVSGQTIDGNSTYIMGGGGSLTLLSDGTNWTIVNQVGSWINYTPVWSGFSSDPPIARAVYFLSGKMCTVALICSASGTSNATTLTVTVPFPAKQSALLWAFGFNNSAILTTVARLDLATGSSTASAFISPNGSAWTSSGGKRLNFTITYEIQ